MYKKSIVYVNYSPYENSGHILDYLLENFEKVFLFTIAFHALGNSKSLNKFSIYEKGKLIKEEYLYYMRVPQKFVFFLIPIRSMMNAIQIFSRLIKLKKTYGSIDIFFTVNAFTATLGKILKKLNAVKKTIFWVWDYYPAKHPNLSVSIMRWLYWQFDKYATSSDKIAYLSKKMAEVRKDAGVINKSKKCIIVPIGTGKNLPAEEKNLNEPRIGFIGVLKKSQGIDMLLNSSKVLAESFDNLTFDIIGSGPDEELFKVKAKDLSGISYNFYGLVSEKKFKDILHNATIGIAPYSPGHSTVSKYTDPGKAKRYLECNLPVITTSVTDFSREIEKNGAGIVIKYGDQQALVKAIRKIIKNYKDYVNNAIKLNKQYYYRNIYPAIFA